VEFSNFNIEFKSCHVAMTQHVYLLLAHAGRQQAGITWCRIVWIMLFLEVNVIRPRVITYVRHYVSLSARKVETGIREMNVNQPPGQDGTPTRFWRLFPRNLVPLILRILNTLLFCSTFPDCFKDCTALPLYKGKGARTDPKSYRPISILSPLSKMMAGLMHHRITTFLQRWRLPSPHQHGFRNSHSTGSAVIKFTNDCFKAGHPRLMTGAVFLDYRSEFPSVPIPALTYKLRRYGIRGRVHKWLCSYLECWPMKVSIGEASSSPTIS